MEIERNYLRFKEITVENWSEPDKTSLIFVEMSKKTGEVSFMSGSDWANIFLNQN